MRRFTYDPLETMDQLRREIDRIFGDYGLGQPFEPMPEFQEMWRGEWPLLNMSEDDERIIVEALVPGMGPEDLKISLVGDQLTLSGERKGLPEEGKPEEGKKMTILREERGIGRFTRTMTLPCAANPEDVKAEYHNGVLKITLAKAEAAKPRMIPVMAA